MLQNILEIFAIKDNFQSKTLTPKNKNKIFSKFLSPFPTLSYKNPVSKIETFFDSKLHTRLIIEAYLFCPQQEHGQYIKRNGKSLGEIPIMSINYPTLAHFRHFYPLCPSTTVENSLQITPFYAKQSQSQVCQNQHKHFCNNEIRQDRHLAIQTKQSQFKPNKAKNKPNLTQFKPKTKPIGAKRKSSACLREQTQFKPNLTYGEFGVLKYRNFYSILKNVISIRNEKLNIFYLTHSKEAL